MLIPGRTGLFGRYTCPSSKGSFDLDGERMRLNSNGVEVADWSLEEIRVAALPDGFHVRAEGEEVVLEVFDDGRFAIDLGLRTAHPALRRKMSALLRSDRSD